MSGDDDLFMAMFCDDPAVARIAVRLFREKIIPICEPAHCSQCFEGCEQCAEVQPGITEPIK